MQRKLYWCKEKKFVLHKRVDNLFQPLINFLMSTKPGSKQKNLRRVEKGCNLVSINVSISSVKQYLTYSPCKIFGRKPLFPATWMLFSATSLETVALLHRPFKGKRDLTFSSSSGLLGQPGYNTTCSIMLIKGMW